MNNLIILVSIYTEDFCPLRRPSLSPSLFLSVDRKKWTQTTFDLVYHMMENIWDFFQLEPF